MATISEAEILLKEQIELQKGLNLTVTEFKGLINNSKQYQQMLRAINRELLEHNSLYGSMREKNEKIFDTVSIYTEYLKKNNLTNNFNNIYKSINKVVDEFKDLNSKIQTGDVSIKEYEKSFAKLSNAQKAIEREKAYFNQVLGKSTKAEYDLSKSLLDKKDADLKKSGGKFKDALQKELDVETNKRNHHQRNLNADRAKYERDYKNNFKDRLEAARNPFVANQNDLRQIEESDKKIRDLRRKIKIAPDKQDYLQTQRAFDEKATNREDFINLQESLEKDSEITDTLLENFTKTKNEVEYIDKKIGNIGRTMSVLKGFGLNNLFDFEAVEDAMQSAAREEYVLEEQRKRGVDTTIQKFGVLRAGLGAIGREISEKFLPVGVIGGGLWLGKQILDLMFQFDERWREISKNQNMNREDAVQLLNTYQAMSKENEKMVIYGMSIRKTAATQKELLEATHTLTTGLGLNYTIASKQEGDLLANLKERMGLSDELRQTSLENSVVSNQGLEEYLGSLLGVNSVNRANNKFYVNDKALLNDISKVSAAIRLQFKNHGSDLAKIVIDSKKYGMNIQNIDASMDGMLDWEKQNELQTSFFAQTGQYIDTSRLQIYAQINDIKRYQEEYDRLIGTTEEFNNLNRIAQQTKASMFNLSREEMAQTLFDKELNQKIVKNEMALSQMQARQTEDAMRKEYNALKERGIANEQIYEILGKQSLSMMSQIKSSDEFGRAIEKIKDTFASFVQNEDIEELIQSFSNLISGASEFLMEHSDILGIRTKTGVEDEYTKYRGGVSVLKGKMNLPEQTALGTSNRSLIRDSEKDYQSIKNDYLKQYQITNEDKKSYLDFIDSRFKSLKPDEMKGMSLKDFMTKSTNQFLKDNSYFNSNNNEIFNKYFKDNERALNLNIKERDELLQFVTDKMKNQSVKVNPKDETYKLAKDELVNQYFEGKAKKVNDSIISPSGKVMISTPEGRIAPNPKDYLITTTNPSSLMQKGNVINQYTINETKIVDTLTLVQKEIAKSTETIVKAVLANKDVYIGYKKISETIAMNNSRI